MRKSWTVLLSLVLVASVSLVAWCATPVAKPADSSPWAKMFPKGLIDAAGKPVNVKALEGKIVGVYFSAHWCPPCRAFTPELVKFRDKNTTDLEVVFVSSDKDKAAMQKYMTEMKMKWTAVEWQSPAASAAQKKYDVRGIPTLVILSPTGQEITREGRADVTDKPGDAIAKWKKAAAELASK